MKIFTLSYSSAIEGFDDAPVRDFMKDKHIAEIKEYFYVHEKLPRLTLIVYYRPGELPAAVKSARVNKVKAEDEALAILDETDVPLYQYLRDWRNERAKADTVPPYVICNNKQLALMVKHKPQSLAQLLKIEGIGPERIKRYGQVLLDQLSKPIPTRKTQQENGETTS